MGVSFHARGAKTLQEQGLQLVVLTESMELERKFFDKMEKALSTSIAARFLKVEHQIGLLVELGQVEETPLMSPIKK